MNFRYQIHYNKFRQFLQKRVAGKNPPPEILDFVCERVVFVCAKYAKNSKT